MLYGSHSSLLESFLDVTSIIILNLASSSLQSSLATFLEREIAFKEFTSMHTQFCDMSHTHKRDSSIKTKKEKK